MLKGSREMWSSTRVRVALDDRRTSLLLFWVVQKLLVRRCSGLDQRVNGAHTGQLIEGPSLC